MSEKRDPIWGMLGVLFKAHPWHGVSIGASSPGLINTYIEMVPSDAVKYELDKKTGHLKVDRPQVYSSTCPTLYGLVPQTLCADRTAAFCGEKIGRTIQGDNDPLDICVLTERVILRGDILMETIPIGGLRMIDHDEADDKIIAVLKNDSTYGHWTDISDCPKSIIDRLKHYFLNYKSSPNQDETSPCQITHVYGRDEAHEVIRRAQEDYMARYANIEAVLTKALRG